MRLSGRVGAMACAALLAACGDATGSGGERMDLGHARRLWDARRVDDYRMTVWLGGAWMSGGAVIQVRDGVPVSVQAVGEGPPVPVQVFSHYDTVEELFAVLQHAVDEDADRIDARFHSRYGVPLQVSIDVRESWADDEHGFTVGSFQPE